MIKNNSTLLSFNSVTLFEQQLAEFYGAPYAVTTDCCTHAIELCLRLSNANNVTTPTNTYISIPFTFIKLGLNWNFDDTKWKDFYCIGNTNIIDAAVYWKENGYVLDSLMCLSFQFKKHLSLGRGGAILLDNVEQYCTLKKMSYDGRIPDIPWSQQDIDEIGYHYYMTPETAQQGIDKILHAKKTPPKQWSWKDYPNLRNMTVFKNR